MKIAWVGLGKLGGPCALALAAAAHEIRGIDTDPATLTAVHSGVWPHDEPGVNELIGTTRSRFSLNPGYLADAINDIDAVFVAVQTPHGPGYGGEIPAPTRRAPFDTSHLVAAVAGAHVALTVRGNPAPIVVVSTVLPGTCRDELEPILDGRTLIYSPAFVAMGSVLHDLEHPEFILAGVRDKEHADLLRAVYAHVDAPLIVTAIESAELAKMAYNTAVTSKIVFANALAELAAVTSADVDEVTDVLAAATNRVTSSRYLSAGMGDGGPCHPRDGIAMAWLAQQSGVSVDVWEFLVRAREAQAERLGRLTVDRARASDLPVVVCGRAYKEGVSIEAGSAGLLVGSYVDAAGVTVTWDASYPDAAVFLIALPSHAPDRFPDGSVVIDPWGRTPLQDGITLIRPGRR